MRLAAAAAALSVGLAFAPAARAADPAWTPEETGLVASWYGHFAWDSAAKGARFVGCASIEPECAAFDRGAQGWTMRGAAGPSRRTLFGAAFDDARGAWVVFGGSTGSYSGETWELHGPTWSKGPAGPTPRMAPSMAYDAARAKVVLFGGEGAYDDCSWCGDTWEYDGAWHAKSPAKAPSARYGAALVASPDLGGVLLVGGHDREGCTNDAWVWDGTSWSALETPHHPPAGLRPAAAWDEGRRRVVLVVADTECVYGTSDETWELHDGDWHRVTTNTPVFVSDPSFAYDPQRGQVFGGDALEETTWAYAGQVADGAACGLGVGCTSGHCSRGLCCDAACEGSCAACAAVDGASADGVCGVRARGTDGAPSCTPYLCDGAVAACPAGCAADEDCDASSRCDGVRCVPRTSCSADGTSIEAGDQRSCAPYLCRDGACLRRCGSGTDCAEGRVCGTDGACTASPATEGGGGGCALAPRDRSWAGLAAIAIAAALFARRRR